MAAVIRCVADTSALARMRHAPVDAVIGPPIEAGLVATCAVIELEVLWSTRSVAEYDDYRSDRAAAFEWLSIEDVDGRRAIDVQRALWAAGKMRSVPLTDLLIAAVAERHRVTLLHYDCDYDNIAEVTGQRVEWVVPRGSVP
jgi:predicted nucleic acid-binding protein